MIHIHILNKNVQLSNKDNFCVVLVPNKIKEFIHWSNVKAISILSCTRLDGEVVLKCSEFGVLLSVDKKKKSISCWYSNIPSAAWQLKYKQLLWKKNQDLSARMFTHWLILKLNNQIFLIKKHSCIKQFDLEQYLKTMQMLFDKGDFKSIENLEGIVSKTYYSGLRLILPKSLGFNKRYKREPKDIVNACINYSYGILYRMCEQAILSAGLDLYIGYKHSIERGGKAFLFDFIVPFRPWANEVVLQLLIYNTNLDGKAFNGVISYDLKKALVKIFYDHFNQIVRFNRRQLSRQNHIYAFAEQTAKQIKQQKFVR